MTTPQRLASRGLAAIAIAFVIGAFAPAFAEAPAELADVETSESLGVCIESSESALPQQQEAPEKKEKTQVECRYTCPDGHDGVLACGDGVTPGDCGELLFNPNVCANHGGRLASFNCDYV